MTNILTKEQVNQFLTARKKAATLTATGVLLCILSSAPLLALISFARFSPSTPPLEIMISLGVIILLIIVATGVAFFIAANRHIKIYEKLEYEDCKLDEETTKQVQAQKEHYASTYTTMTIIATVLCIISAIPILCGAFFTSYLSGNQIDSLMTGLVAITLVLISIGVFFFVKNNTIEDGYDILLQVKDYSPKNKIGRKKMRKYATIYWLIATALYLGYSFVTENWEHSWIVWPIAGITYGIIEKLFSLKGNNLSSE